jgi:multimeric flavodoxin WrbA
MNRSITVVGINGSERVGGTTGAALDMVCSIVTDRGAAFDRVDVADLQLAPIGACGDCNFRPTPCGITDGLDAALHRLIVADVILYAAPVHGFGLASPMQQFIERAGVCHLRFTRPLANKIGGVIVTGRRYSHTGVYSQLLMNVLLNRMIVVGSGYPSVIQPVQGGPVEDDAEGTAALMEMVNRSIDMAEVLARNVDRGHVDQLPIRRINERAS